MKRAPRPIFWFLFTVIVASSGGCGDSSVELEEVQRAVAIESRDECHLCGMIISRFPGPKGELYQHGRDRIFKFCSTRDMFAYLLDPEQAHSIESIYVHDMSKTLWDTPDDEFFIDARKAWYVIGHNQPGAMGPTLASFSDKKTADDFSSKYGGRVLPFQSIDNNSLHNNH